MKNLSFLLALIILLIILVLILSEQFLAALALSGGAAILAINSDRAISGNGGVFSPLMYGGNSESNMIKDIMDHGYIVHLISFNMSTFEYTFFDGKFSKVDVKNAEHMSSEIKSKKIIDSELKPLNVSDNNKGILTTPRTLGELYNKKAFKSYYHTFLGTTVYDHGSGSWRRSNTCIVAPIKDQKGRILRLNPADTPILDYINYKNGKIFTSDSNFLDNYPDEKRVELVEDKKNFRAKIEEYIGGQNESESEPKPEPKPVIYTEIMRYVDSLQHKDLSNTMDLYDSLNRFADPNNTNMNGKQMENILELRRHEYIKAITNTPIYLLTFDQNYIFSRLKKFVDEREQESLGQIGPDNDAIFNGMKEYLMAWMNMGRIGIYNMGQDLLNYMGTINKDTDRNELRARYELLFGQNRRAYIECMMTFINKLKMERVEWKSAVDQFLTKQDQEIRVNELIDNLIVKKTGDKVEEIKFIEEIAPRNLGAAEVYQAFHTPCNDQRMPRTSVVDIAQGMFTFNCGDPRFGYLVEGFKADNGGVMAAVTSKEYDLMSKKGYGQNEFLPISGYSFYRYKLTKYLEYAEKKRLLDSNSIETIEYEFEHVKFIYFSLCYFRLQSKWNNEYNENYNELINIHEKVNIEKYYNDYDSSKWKKIICEIDKAFQRENLNDEKVMNRISAKYDELLSFKPT